MNESTTQLQLVSSAKLPTRFGMFMIYGFRYSNGSEDISMISIPNIESLQGKSAVPLRIHSACHTGDTLSSLRCDCQAQLHAAQRYIARKNCGAIIYLPQEGRGIGLIAKIKAYHLQDAGLDTAEANASLGFKDDLRDYRAAAEIVRYCLLDSVAILTNNPDKVAQMRKYGVKVADRIPLRVGRNRHNRSYLRVKRDRFDHDL